MPITGCNKCVLAVHSQSGCNVYLDQQLGPNADIKKWEEEQMGIATVRFGAKDAKEKNKVSQQHKLHYCFHFRLDLLWMMVFCRGVNTPMVTSNSNGGIDLAYMFMYIWYLPDNAKVDH